MQTGLWANIPFLSYSKSLQSPRESKSLEGLNTPNSHILEWYKLIPNESCIVSADNQADIYLVVLVLARKDLCEIEATTRVCSQGVVNLLKGHPIYSDRLDNRIWLYTCLVQALPCS